MVVVVAVLGSSAACGRRPRCDAPTFEYMGHCVFTCETAPSGFCDADSGAPVGDAGGGSDAEAGASDRAETGEMGDGVDVSADAACAPGATRCGAACVDLATDTANCGACGQRCAGPAANGRAACAMGVCGVACDRGYERVAASARCDVRVPRQIAPMSTARVTNHRPTLRWELGDGVDGATVELCRDRAMGVACQTVDAVGASAMPRTTLTPGVWFWRVRGRIGGVVGTTTGPVWQFTVGARSAVTDASWGATLDVNGDGYGDLAVGAPGAAGGAGRVHVYLGSDAGVVTASRRAISPPATRYTRFGTIVMPAGDVNGDGFGDLLVESTGAPAGHSIHVYSGGASGLAAMPTTREGAFFVIAGRFYAGANSSTAVGDVNGDGYSDVVVRVASLDPRELALLMFYGSRDGVRTEPVVAMRSPEQSWGETFAGLGDVNGDGNADLAITTPQADGGVGRVDIHLGANSGLAPLPSYSYLGLDGTRAGFGLALAGAGDLNGDGFADILIGAPGAMTSGRAYVALGARSHTDAPGAFALPVPMSEYYSHGRKVFGLGDVNGDGLEDVAVAGWSAAFAGRVLLHLGASTGLGSTAPIVVEPGADVARRFGEAASGGDFNGNGANELVIGTPEPMSNAGGAVVYGVAGGRVGLAMPGQLAPPDGAGGEFGWALSAGW